MKCAEQVWPDLFSKPVFCLKLGEKYPLNSFPENLLNSVLMSLSAQRTSLQIVLDGMLGMRHSAALPELTTLPFDQLAVHTNGISAEICFMPFLIHYPFCQRCCWKE